MTLMCRPVKGLILDRRRHYRREFATALTLSLSWLVIGQSAVMAAALPVLRLNTSDVASGSVHGYGHDSGAGRRPTASTTPSSLDLIDIITSNLNNATRNIVYHNENDSVPTGPPEVSVPGGQALTLACPMRGTPPALGVQWTKNGQVVPPGEWRVNPGNLTTMHATSQHSGVYTCTTWDARGVINSHQVHVVVTGLQFRSLLPGVTRVRTGTRLVLACETVGSGHGGGTLGITWYKDSTVIGRRSSSTFNMTVSHVSREDVGFYTCEASFEGSEISMGTHLSVFAPLEFLQPGSTAVIHANKGELLTLHCSVIGYPEPEIDWSKDGKPIKQRTDWYTKRGLARKTHATVSDQGTYTCTAHNGREERSRSVLVNVMDTDVPGQLTVTVTPLPGWPPVVKVQWNTSSGRRRQPVTSCSVTYAVIQDGEPGNVTWSTPEVVSPEQDFVLLSHLKLGAKYVVKVWANNNQGAGQATTVDFRAPWWGFMEPGNTPKTPNVKEMLDKEVGAALSPRYPQLWVLTVVGSIIFGTVFFALFTAYKHNCDKSLKKSQSMSALLRAASDVDTERPSLEAGVSTANNSVSFLNPLFDSSCVRPVGNHDTASLNNLDLIWHNLASPEVGGHTESYVVSPV